RTRAASAPRSPAASLPTWFGRSNGRRVPMAQPTVLPAEPRTLEGKSHLTRLRREGKIPAVMYGREISNTPILLDGKAFEQFLKRHGASGIVEVQIGADRGAAVIKEVQRHPVSGRVLHLDLQRISMQDRITSA